MQNIEKLKPPIDVSPLKYHPDRNSSPVSENSIKIINAAFEVLSDKDKRKQYDEKLS